MTHQLPSSLFSSWFLTIVDFVATTLKGNAITSQFVSQPKRQLRTLSLSFRVQVYSPFIFQINISDLSASPTPTSSSCSLITFCWPAKNIRTTNWSRDTLTFSIKYGQQNKPRDRSERKPPMSALNDNNLSYMGLNTKYVEYPGGWWLYYDHYVGWLDNLLTRQESRLHIKC